MAEVGGPARILRGLYALFVLAAGGRSIAQLVVHPGRAPLAYGLSAVAAAAYAVGLVLVVRADRGRPRAAGLWSGVELAGVVAVGVASYAVPSAFPDRTVWSHFGQGYGYVPVMLPLLVLLWLRYGAPDGQNRRTNPGGRGRSMGYFDQIKNKAEDLAKKAKPRADELKEKAGPLAQSLKEKAEQAAATAKAKADELRNNKSDGSAPGAPAAGADEAGSGSTPNAS